MRPFIRTIETTEFDGGWLCLDFINTVKSRFEEPIQDYLIIPSDWLIWSKRQNLLNKSQLRNIELYMKENTKVTSNSLKTIIEFRENIYKLFKAIAHNKKPSKDSLQCVSESISFCFNHYSLDLIDNKKLTEHFSVDNNPLLTPFLEIIKSSYELLKSDKLARVKECENCGWLFLDKSKNSSRRWCNMQTCGSSEKTKRYYRKIRLDNQAV